MIPALFVSHGAPTLSLDPGLTGAMWRELATSLVKPDAVLVVSAHWETSAPQVGSAAQPKTMHDFGGFPDTLYAIQYPAPGAPQLASRVAELLGVAGLVTTLHPSRGLDHGAWVPMRLMYPDADIPCTQLSIQTRMGTRYACAVGQAISELRKENDHADTMKPQRIPLGFTYGSLGMDAYLFS
jgi:4,5-DOPA dioxygenase extradiol